MTCANMCGVQLAMIDIAAGKPILHKFAWKVIWLIENKKTKTWMCDNADRITHLPMFFMEKNHQVFLHLACFSQNSINTNKIELGNEDFDTKMVVTAVNLALKLPSKMQEHIDNNSFPKDVPAFAGGFLSMPPGEGSFTLRLLLNNLLPTPPLSRPKLILTASASLPAKSKKTARKAMQGVLRQEPEDGPLPCQEGDSGRKCFAQ